MERDTLGLADDGLFVEKIKHLFKAADVDLLIRARSFSLERVAGSDSTGYQAADLLVEQGADAIAIAGALIAPLLWRRLADPADIRDHFGTEVAASVENLRIPFCPPTDHCQYQQDDIHALLASMGGVPRKALLLITFRLLALESATDFCQMPVRKIAQETLDLFVPIANRLGLGDLRRRLEDACFQILDPKGFAVLMKNVSPIQVEDVKCLQILLTGLRRFLGNNGIQGRVQGRTKILHGIRSKMARTGKTLEEIMDRIGLRVIVMSVPECYTVLGLLHVHFKPIPGTFDDYIGLPKDNGYQSLHTCVYPRKIALIGNHLPRQCGIVTFTTDLLSSLAEENPSGECWAVVMNDVPEGYRYPGRVRFEINQRVLAEYRLAADFLNMNRVEVVCLQHEFGIFGGDNGVHVLDLLGGLRMPLVTTLHTVIQAPTSGQMTVARRIAQLSDRLVVMSRKAGQLLQTVYGVPAEKIALIHHGIPDVPFVDPSFFKDQYGVEGRKVILTFGLLSPGKGVETVIDALPAVVREHPQAVYIVLGATHPHVKRDQGESYRLSLQRRARELGVGDHVIFHNRFVDLKELCEFLGAADIYVTPYLNQEQIVLGTLAYALGSGKATVSTPYWYAEEMLVDGRGRIVPFQDPAALADQINDLFAQEVFEKALPALADFNSPRAWAFALVGIHGYLSRFGGDSEVRRIREKLANKLLRLFRDNASEDWPWIEDTVTYANGKIPQALILSGRWQNNAEMLNVGLRSLEWLMTVQTDTKGHFVPVGNNGWYSRGGAKARFDQQPIEALDMIEACREAYEATNDSKWVSHAQCCLELFLGRNDLNAPMYDHKSGGCCDGLQADGPNRNQGAESTLVCFLSLLVLNQMRGRQIAVEATAETSLETRREVTVHGQ